MNILQRISNLIRYKYKVFKRWFWFDWLHKSQIIKSFNWGRIKVYNDHLGKLIYMGNYEKFELQILKNILKEGMTVIDVGANIGYHSVFFANSCQCNVFSFEPSKREFERFKENIRINGLDKVVIPVNLGLGSEESSVELNIDNYNYGMNSIVTSAKSSGKQKIEIIRLDKFIADHSIPRVGLIKADVEGYEPEVFKGAVDLIQRDQPVIFYEDLKFDMQHKQGLVSDNELHRFFEKHQYKIFYVDGDGILKAVENNSENIGTNFFAFPSK